MEVMNLIFYSRALYFLTNPLERFVMVGSGLFCGPVRN
jgi:hypothetical protein